MCASQRVSTKLVAPLGCPLLGSPGLSRSSFLEGFIGNQGSPSIQPLAQRVEIGVMLKNINSIWILHNNSTNKGTFFTFRSREDVLWQQVQGSYSLAYLFVADFIFSMVFFSAFVVEHAVFLHSWLSISLLTYQMLAVFWDILLAGNPNKSGAGYSLFVSMNIKK